MGLDSAKLWLMESHGNAIYEHFLIHFFYLIIKPILNFNEHITTRVVGQKQK